METDTLTDVENIPSILTDVLNIGKRGYTLTEAQKARRKRGQSIYNRDTKVEEYKYSKGEWV